jgi:Protein kinase domain
MSGSALTKGLKTNSEHLRGTAHYRAPELFKEQTELTPKVDLWSLGCILFECLTGSKVFESNLQLLQYSESDRDDIISSRQPLSSSPIWCNLLGSTIHDLLSVDQDQRPTAAETVDLLVSYDRILITTFSQLVFNCEYGMSYESGNILRLISSNDIEWMYEFANEYGLQGQDVIANAVLDEAGKIYLRIIRSLQELDSRMAGPYSSPAWASWFADDPGLEATLVWYRRLLAHIPVESLAWVCYEVALYLLSKEMPDMARAISICHLALEHRPKNVVISMLLSNLYAETGSDIDARQMEEQSINSCNELNDVVAVESQLSYLIQHGSRSDFFTRRSLTYLLHS